MTDASEKWDDHRRDHELLAQAVRDAAGARATDDDYLTRREAEVLLAAGRTAAESAFEAHEKVHESEAAATEMALKVQERDRLTHDGAHDREHGLHADKHMVEGNAVTTALEAVARERQIHAEAHEREHTAHQREHVLANLAIDKAERATDQRFASTNAFREQLNDVIRTLVTKDAFETFQRDSNRRFEEQRLAITNLEKGDVKGEGRTMGQGAVVGWIVGAVGVAVSILSAIILVANFATGSTS